MSDPAPDPAPLPRYLALLWGRSDGTPRRGPKPTLTVHDIGRAAVAIADEDGWESVSMKAIAKSLGMTTMSLYRYVDGKDDVIDIMVDQAYGPADPSVLTGDDWRVRITAWAHAVAERMRLRPWLAAVALPRPPLGPNTLSWSDSGIRAFDQTPLRGPQKLNALLLVDGFVRQHVRQASQMGLLGTTAPGPGPGPDYQTSVMALINKESYPGLIVAAADTDSTSAEGDFFAEQMDFGLSVIIDGLAALMAR